MSIYYDNRVVMTLDAGGTNFVFGAMQGGKEVIKPIPAPSLAHDLELCLKGIVDGFNSVKEMLDVEPVAISFAFPGPADYNNGIIGDLVNLPAFRGGIALGPMLEKVFGVPVFIQNDGDLYAYGEALGGVLYEVNETLEQMGSPKRYKNLVAFTLGTGFGAGLVHDGVLISGDNSIPAEIWNTSNSISPERNAEEGVSTRAIINAYESKAGVSESGLMPYDIYKIAVEEAEGDKQAALDAFTEFGTHIGDAAANLMMLFDSMVVIGGGITGAKDLYMPAVMNVLKGKFKCGQDRLVHEVFNLDEEGSMAKFCESRAVSVKIPMTDEEVIYDKDAKLAIATTRVGASQAIALGAYAYALNQLDKASK